MPQDPSEFYPQPNDRFAAELRGMYQQKVAIPGAMDEAILRASRSHLARRSSRTLVLRIGALVTAAAAMIVIVLHLHQPSNDAPQPTVAMQSSTSVNIVDALKLARRIRAGQPDSTHDDINRDGRIDQSDVDAIAMAAVQLPEGRLQ